MSGREGVLNVTIATSECFFFSFFCMYTLVLSNGKIASKYLQQGSSL